MVRTSMQVLTVVCLLATAASSLRVVPHQLAYFNELAGGPENGHAHLTHSNLDWGQDLLFLKEWMDEHPEARPMWLRGSSMYEARDLGLDVDSPQQKDWDDNQPRWIAMRATELQQHGLLSPVHGEVRGDDELTEQLRSLKPIARAGMSVYIYELPAKNAD